MDNTLVMFPMIWSAAFNKLIANVACTVGRVVARLVKFEITVVAKLSTADISDVIRVHTKDNSVVDSVLTGVKTMYKIC